MIGPIGDQLADPGSDGRRAYEEAIEVYEEVIKAACDSLSIEVFRADDISDSGEIPEQIFASLRDEDLVIADLTGANPNVMYELGIRHVTGKCTLLIGEKDRLPFDVSTIRTTMFRRSPSGLIQARKQLVKAVGAALANGCPPSSAARVLGLHLSRSSGVDKPVADADPQESIDLTQAESEEAMGLLEAAVELEDGLPDLTNRLVELASVMGRTNDITREYAERMRASDRPAHKLGTAADYAKTLEPVVREFDASSVELEARVRSLTLAIDAVLQHLSDGNELDAADFVLDSTIDLAENSRRAREEGVAGYRKSLNSISNASRELRPVVALMKSSTDRIAECMEHIERWGERATAVRGTIKH